MKTNKTKGEKNMKTKKELGYKYYNLLTDIISYTNDSQDIHFTLEKVLTTYVPTKVLKVWIARAEEELKEHELKDKERA
tara:strand:+ start:261 stop:497 length:237 start_codon:yes stop_codon:yes gene_type:complete